MSRRDDLAQVLDRGIVAILRASSGEQLVNVARALYEGGIDVIEVTFTVPRVLEIVSALERDLGDRILLGAGTVLDTESAKMALSAGAEFIVSPALNLDVIRLCHRYDKLCLPGVYTPTEVLSAWEAGAEIVKVFPAEIGGPPLLKALHGPFPQVRLMPTGGVNLQTMRAFFEAGACAVGLGSALVEKSAVEKGDMGRLRDLAGQYTSLLRDIRATP